MAELSLKNINDILFILFNEEAKLKGKNIY